LKLLLDTHALYWYVEGDPKLSTTAQAIIQNMSNQVLVSPACFWEIAIKASIGKWILNRPYEEFVDLALRQYGFELLPILPTHTGKLIGLPFPQNHRDPFDRLLVAQALVEQIPVVSCDSKLDQYPINRIW